MKYILLLCCGIVVSLKAFCCDVCGGAFSTGSNNIMPLFSKHLAGIRYQHSFFNSKGHDGKSSSIEYFNNITLWGRWNATKRLQLFAFVPMVQNKRIISNNESEKVSGLGDVSLILNFVMLSNMQSNRILKHALQVGTGAKIPSGKHDELKNGLMLNPGMQAGTGSFDFTSNLIYNVRYRSLGCILDATYVKNGKNNQSFRFGNKFNSSIRFFTWQKKNLLTYLPIIGVSNEYANQDLRYNIKQHHTGGHITYSTFGLDMYIKKIGFMTQTQLPIYQYLGEGNIIAKPRLQVNLIFLF